MTFEMPALMYAKSALELHTSAETLDYHHDKYHNAQVVNLADGSSGIVHKDDAGKDFAFSPSSSPIAYAGVALRYLFALLIGLAVSFSGGAVLAAEPEDGSLVTPAKKQMDQLAETAVREAVKVVGESGGFYPFALVMDAQEKVRVIGYSGSDSEKPTPEEYVKTLFWQVRHTVEHTGGLVSAVIVKPHFVTTDKGQRVPGIWAAADHLEADPWVMFLPFLPGPDGTYSLGEIIYTPGQEPIFLPEK